MLPFLFEYYKIKTEKINENIISGFFLIFAPNIF